jgi:membrane-bound metal-dependent hydrolase YbcI (DUF457 family)
LQFAVKHRGFFHSLTFCAALSAVFVFFAPILALPFFLGCSSHIFADSFTEEGIMPFWPWKKTSSGPLRTEGKAENIIFLGLAALDALLFAGLFI